MIAYAQYLLWMPVNISAWYQLILSPRVKQFKSQIQEALSFSVESQLAMNIVNEVSVRLRMTYVGSGYFLRCQHGIT